MERKDTNQAQIKFLGFRCSKLEFIPSEDYINGGAPTDLSLNFQFKGHKPEGDKSNFQLLFELEMTEASNSTRINASFIGLFSTNIEITVEFLNSAFLKVNAPAILFPYVRSYISTITMNAGLESLILPTINFMARYNKEQENKKTQEDQKE